MLLNVRIFANAANRSYNLLGNQFVAISNSVTDNSLI